MGFILNPLYNIVSGVIVFIHKLLEPLFGADSGVTWTLSIMGLVVLIRIILIPLFVKQIKSQRALTALQPHMKEIQKKYKDDRQKQSEEMMKLYKEHKTNPLASCFPILAQAPIFFALFTVLNGIAAKTPEGVSAPIARGFLKGEYLDSAAQAAFFGAKISQSFLGSTDTTVKIVTVLLIIFILLLNLFHMWLQCCESALALDLLHKEWNQNNTDENNKSHDGERPCHTRVSTEYWFQEFMDKDNNARDDVIERVKNKAH